MKTAIAGVILAAAALLPPTVANGEHRTDFRRLADGRFDPAVVVLRLERTLAAQQRLGQPAQIEYSSPYLPPTPDDAGVDAQIRRMGELIRRADREQQ